MKSQYQSLETTIKVALASSCQVSDRSVDALCRARESSERMANGRRQVVRDVLDSGRGKGMKREREKDPNDFHFCIPLCGPDAAGDAAAAATAAAAASSGARMAFYCCSLTRLRLVSGLCCRNSSRCRLLVRTCNQGEGSPDREYTSRAFRVS